jgi:hypothetical protein
VSSSCGVVFRVGVKRLPISLSIRNIANY